MRSSNCSNTLTAITLINSDKTVHSGNLIMMHLKLGDFVSGFVNAERLCRATLPIAESTGPNVLSEIISVIYIVVHDMEVQLCKVPILYSVKDFIKSMTKTLKESFVIY